MRDDHFADLRDAVDSWVACGRESYNGLHIPTLRALLDVADSAGFMSDTDMEAIKTLGTRCDRLTVELKDMRAECDRLAAALQFYADREHLHGSLVDEWEECSDQEAAGLLFPPEPVDDEPWAVEDGSVARAALALEKGK